MNKFKLNFEKIKAMVISRKKTPPQPTILLRDHRVEYIESYKLLGVTISNNLSWRPYIVSTISKAKRLLGFIYRTSSQGGQGCLSRLYQSIVLPHLDYCSCVWDPPHKTHLKKLESVQSFAARIITGNWVDSSQALKSKLQWPSLASRRLFQKLCVCKRILVGSSILSPDIFLKHAKPTGSHKNIHPLYRPYVRMLYHKSSFRHSVVDHWNKVPQSIVGLSSSKAFKLSLRKFICDN